MLFDPWNWLPTRLLLHHFPPYRHMMRLVASTDSGFSTSQRRVYHKILMNCPLDEKKKSVWKFNDNKYLKRISWHERRLKCPVEFEIVEILLLKIFFFHLVAAIITVEVEGMPHWGMNGNKKNPRTRIAEHSTIRKFRRFCCFASAKWMLTFAPANSDFGVFFCFLFLLPLYWIWTMRSHYDFKLVICMHTWLSTTILHSYYYLEEWASTYPNLW